MRFTDAFKLPCLDGSDYAAYALYMQCLGEQVDTILGDQLDAFTEFQMRPSALWTASATHTAFNGSPLTNFVLTFSTNWPGGVPPVSPTLGNLRGWWQVGANVNLISSGAVTLNTYRRLDLEVNPPIGAPGFPADKVFTDNSWESNTGNGENLLSSGTVYTTGSDSTSPLAGGFLVARTFNNNAVNLVTTLTPPATIWATYIGDSPEIQAVP